MWTPAAAGRRTGAAARSRRREAITQAGFFGPVASLGVHLRSEGRPLRLSHHGSTLVELAPEWRLLRLGVAPAGLNGQLADAAEKAPMNV
jgi:hypothetical protein